MGTDKATIRLGGVTLAERLTAIARAALPGVRVTLVAAGTEQFPTCSSSSTFTRIAVRSAVRVQALTHAKTEWLFLAACDLPFITADLIGRLCSLLSGDADAVVPIQSDGIVQPLCALYCVDPCLKKAQQMLEKQKRHRFRDFLDADRNAPGALLTRSAIYRALRTFLNINTPADLERARLLGV